MNCSDRTGKPCRCRRHAGECPRCGQEFTVSHGEFAPPLPLDDKGRIVGYPCMRCRR